MTNKQIEETQTAIAQLFELEGINQVICVDDQYREFPDGMISDVMRLLKTLIRDNFL